MSLTSRNVSIVIRPLSHRGPDLRCESHKKGFLSRLTLCNNKIPLLFVREPEAIMVILLELRCLFCIVLHFLSSFLPSVSHFFVSIAADVYVGMCLTVGVDAL